MRWTLWASWILAWRKSRWLESWIDSKTEYHMVKGMMDEFSKSWCCKLQSTWGQFHFAGFQGIIQTSDHWSLKNILGRDVKHGLLRIILFDWLVDWESSFPPPTPALKTRLTWCWPWTPALQGAWHCQKWRRCTHRNRKKGGKSSSRDGWYM